jgi:uncharacterized protein (DUF433 family)
MEVELAGVSFQRITCNPEILRGKPIIRGTRISVEFIMELVESGASRDEIVEAYPHLTREDVEEAIRYASQSLKNEELILAETASS